MTYNRKTVLPFCFALGLLLAAAFVLGGCSIPNSRDQLQPPSQLQRSIEPVRVMAFGWAVR